MPPGSAAGAQGPADPPLSQRWWPRPQSSPCSWKNLQTFPWHSSFARWAKTKTPPSLYYDWIMARITGNHGNVTLYIFTHTACITLAVLLCVMLLQALQALFRAGMCKPWHWMGPEWALMLISAGCRPCITCLLPFPASSPARSTATA